MWDATLSVPFPGPQHVSVTLPLPDTLYFVLPNPFRVLINLSLSFFFSFSEFCVSMVASVAIKMYIVKKIDLGSKLHICFSDPLPLHSLSVIAPSLDASTPLQYLSLLLLSPFIPFQWPSYPSLSIKRKVQMASMYSQAPEFQGRFAHIGPNLYS